MVTAQKSRTYYSLLNIGVNIVGYFINIFLGFVTRVIFVRTLPTEYLGLSGLFSNIFGMLSLAELGIGTAIVYALYKPLAENDEKQIAALMQFYSKAYRIIGIIVTLLGLGLLPFLNLIIKDAPAIKESLHLLFALHIFTTALTYFVGYRSTLLSAAQKHYYVAGLSYIITIVQSIVQIVLLLCYKNYLIYVLVQVGFSIVYNFLISYLTTQKYPCITHPTEKVNPEAKKSLIKNIKAIVIQKISEVFVNGIDNLFITVWWGLKLTGLASNYTLLSGMLSTITNRIFNSLTASVGNFNAVESSQRQQDFLKILMLANFWVFGWVSIGIFVVSSDAVELFFGAKFVLPIYVPLVLALNFYIVTMNSAASTYISTLGLFHQVRYLACFTAILNLIFTYIMGTLWGFVGVYIATFVARMLTTAWYVPFVVYRVGLKEKLWHYFRLYFRFVTVEIITGILCYLACYNIHFLPIFNVILKMLICTVLPHLVFYLCFRHTAEFVYLQNKCLGLLAKIKNKLPIHQN